MREQKLFDEAEEAYQEAINIDPEFIDALVNLGTLYFDQENYCDAELMFFDAYNITPDDYHSLDKLLIIKKID